MQDADEGLAGREAGRDLGAERRALDAVDEALDDRQCDVRLEQRHAHFAQRLGDVLFGHATAAAQRLHGALEALGQLVEHAGCRSRRRPIQSVGRPIIRDAWTKRRRIVLILILLGLLLVIAFSSGTEVAMLSVNRYRIRHRAERAASGARVCWSACWRSPIAGSAPIW